MSKEKFDKKLTKLLESNSNFVDDAGELHRANIRERAWKLDHDLVKLLLTDKEVEVKFFKEIEGRWIFDNNTFVDYITDKNFFADSYTKFRNKIGLNIINDIEKQKHLLAKLLDKNQLYVHLSEIEDETFAVSEVDKVLNKVFYGDSDR